MALIPIGGTVIASSQVTPESRVKEVAHLTGGIVSQVAVHDGDRVRKGQVLLRLDTSVSSVDAELSGRSLDQLLAQRARLEAQQNDWPQVRFPAELAGRSDPSAVAAMQDEAQRFRLHRAEQVSLTGQLGERRNQLLRQIDGYAVQIASLQQQQDLIAPELDSLRKLRSQGYVTIHRLNELERTAMQFSGSIGALQAQIAQTNAAISLVNEQRIQLSETGRKEAGEELAKVNITINSQRVSHTASDVAFDRSVIRAPDFGVVDKLSVSAVGDVVKPAEPILVVVPDGDRLVLEAMLSPSDVDRVRKGQAARVRLSAFSRSETPELAGRVQFVSAETVADARNNMRYYRARIGLNRDDEIKARSLGLIAGMPVEIFIATGDRSLLSYILKPLRDQFCRAFRDE